MNARQARVFREIINGTYQRETILNEEATLFMLAFLEIEVRVDRLFP